MVTTLLFLILCMTGIPVRSVGLILSMNWIVDLISNTLAGQVVVRFGRPMPFILSLIVAAIVCVGYGTLTGVWPFLIARMLWGICWSFLRMEAMQTVFDLAEPSTKGSCMHDLSTLTRVVQYHANVHAGSAQL